MQVKSTDSDSAYQVGESTVLHIDCHSAEFKTANWNAGRRRIDSRRRRNDRNSCTSADAFAVNGMSSLKYRSKNNICGFTFHVEQKFSTFLLPNISLLVICKEKTRSSTLRTNVNVSLQHFKTDRMFHWHAVRISLLSLLISINSKLAIQLVFLHQNTSHYHPRPCLQNSKSAQ